MAFPSPMSIKDALSMEEAQPHVLPPGNPYSNPYTILLLTPRTADHGAYEYDLGQLDPPRALVGKPCVFFRTQNPTNCAWSHMLVLNGLNPVLPSTEDLAQRWHFAIRPDPSTFAVRYSRNGGGIVNEGDRKSDVITEPRDLAEKLVELNYTNERFLYVLTFVKFAGAESEARYRQSIKSFHFCENEWGLHVHLAGDVTESPRYTGLDLEEDHEPERADLFTLTSFASAKDYADWLMSGEHKEMVGKGDGEVRESMVLTQPFFLPPNKAWANYQYDVFGK
ncbi:hypothetical protein K491DRAFT_717465 [Lophiostoma macrostomum CBS 122681]|uniref:Uncharacterized protein n=1 Tax=Lophiostoma macrostomum CBS 122681 TaxID=1314788 RepID=A0A6A6T214_9PLEO|nr:hypothetical protein K491DRAFT_717465 [Lophiostoma macrostomum CBS 122681]